MVKNLKKILSILCVVLMTATVFSAVITNVLADEEGISVVSLNPCVATDENVHVVWQENLTGNMEIYFVNDVGIGNYEDTLREVIEELNTFDDKKMDKKVLENLEKALNYSLDGDYKHSIDRVHKAVKFLDKTENTELINTLVDAVRDFAKTNILYAEYDLTFNNSYIQEAYQKYDMAMEKRESGNYDACIKQFKNSYLKIVEAYEENDETFTAIDFGKIVRISYTEYDSAYPMIYLNDFISVSWVEVFENESHIMYARSTNNGLTWWYLDVNVHAAVYLNFRGIDLPSIPGFKDLPALGDLLGILRKIKPQLGLINGEIAVGVSIIPGCHYLYGRVRQNGFGGWDFGVLPDPGLNLFDSYSVIAIGGDRYYCVPNPDGVPMPTVDLTVTDISFSNIQPKEGEIITIYATVKNIGDASVSGSIGNRFFYGNVQIGDSIISSLQYGNSVTIQQSWTVLPGNRVIKVAADADNLISEAVETNNILERLLYVRYIWMNPGNYFDFETLQQNGTTTQSFQYDIKILDINPDNIMRINETYSQSNVTISFVSIVDLKTRKHLRTGSNSYSSWLWVNNDDVNGGSIQLADKTFSLISTTLNYYVFYWSETSGNESTLYFNRGNHILVKTEDTLIIDGSTINSATNYTASGNAPLPTKSTANTETTSDTTTATTTTAKSGSTILFSDSFDDGNADGWTVSGGHNGMPYWHVTSYRKYSGSYSLVFNDEKGHNYINRASEDGRSYGSAEFTVDLSSVSTATLEYYDWYEVEDLGYDNYDCMYVYISTDGGSTWTELRERDCGDGNQKTWTKQTIDISSYTGQTVKIRFYFDSRDKWYNNYEGWYIDDVVVSAGESSGTGPFVPPYYSGGGWDDDTNGWGVKMQRADHDYCISDGWIYVYAKAYAGPGAGACCSEADAYIIGPSGGSFTVTQTGSYTITMKFTLDGGMEAYASLGGWWGRGVAVGWLTLKGTVGSNWKKDVLCSQSVPSLTFILPTSYTWEDKPYTLTFSAGLVSGTSYSFNAELYTQHRAAAVGLGCARSTCGLKATLQEVNIIYGA